MKKNYHIYKILLPIIILSALVFSGVYSINASTYSGPFPPNSQYNIEQSYLTVETTPEPGEISLYHALDLSVKNETYWPPVAGDYLDTYFKLKNIGGSALTLTNYGVEGTCNSESWSLLADASIELDPDEYVIFDNFFPTQLEVGSCDFVVMYQDEGGWHSIGVTEDFTVSDGEPTPEPAEIVLYYPLDLSVKNSSNWPPYEGDLLKYYFKIKNMGGADANLINYGVYGICNGTETWEVYANQPVILGSHEYRIFEGYFSTGLNQGPCEFIVKYQDELGWHDIGDTVSFTVQETEPGNLEFYYTLRFWVKDNDRWPPIVGDKLVGYFKFKNTGGQAIVLDNMGISGTLNGSTVVEVLKGASLTLEPGQHYIFEKIFADLMEAGNYSFVVVYKEDGTWHEMGDTVEFTVTQTGESTPAELILYHDFTLTVKNNENRWPPQEGDILIAYFKIKNIGGQLATLNNLGVSGTRNGTEDWDLFVNETITLNSDEYYIFSIRYIAPLTPGVYNFQPYYLDAEGWHSIGDNIEFVVEAEEELKPTVTSELMIYSEGSGLWPPIPGDQLKAFYMLRNDTNQILDFEKLGVFGTRENDGDWSLYHFESVSISPEGYWAFDKTFSESLVPGDYKFIISYKDAAGWHTMGSYVNFTVEELEEEPTELDPNILYLNVVGGEYWPPFIGDFVGARFLLTNDSDLDHNYDEVGVYGTKDGSEQILLTYPEPVLIEAGSSWTFNEEFLEGFEAGTYLLTIYTIDDNGFQTIGDYEYFVVELTAESATPPADDLTPETSGSPDPNKTPTPTPTLDQTSGEAGFGDKIPDECEDTIGGWIECNLLRPLQGFFCWIKQIFNPETICTD